MSLLALTSLLLACALGAGLVGSLTGMGGGVVIVPLLVLGLHMDIRYAIGASLVSVIATSSGAAAAYVKEGFTNLRLGMLLEVATTVGAVSGAFVASRVSSSAIGVIFGCVLLYSAYASWRRIPLDSETERRDRIASALRLDGSFPEKNQNVGYFVQHVPGGFALMYLAGVLSGLLGIGSGAMKVLAMDRVMKVPFKVSTTTSNFMIGVTAAASAGVYLNRGYIDPVLAMPIVLGVLAGSLLGARLLTRAPTHILRVVFALVIVALGIEMIFESLTGKL
ncbi:MAG: sulfite exporter TauE/SafE family protein [Myxococcales bacterium]|jgi:hypothetical protein